jgi:aminoglycoside phosphotransferase (APT) family kinase protein
LIGSVLDELRHQGVAAPRYQLIVPADEGTVLVQERMPGEPPTRIDLDTMEAVIQLCEGFADLLADRPDVPPVDLHLRHAGTDLFRHDTLASYDARARHLLGQIHDVASGTDMVAGNDLVHCDLTPGNLLVGPAGKISGVIDWHGPNGLARGDANFGLVIFRFDVAWGTAVDPAYPRVDPDALARLDQHLDGLPEEQLRRYWASTSLRMVDWTIRQARPEDVDHQLAFAATRLN